VSIERDRPYTIDEAAALLHVKGGAVRKWVRDGTLKAARPGKRYLILGSALLAMLESEGKPGPGPSAVTPPEPEPKGRGKRRLTKPELESMSSGERWERRAEFY